MVVNVKYFGMVADAVGKGSEEMDFGTPAVDLRLHFEQLYPQLRHLPWKLAVDQELVEGAVVLRERAEVVLLPPFAGG